MVRLRVGGGGGVRAKESSRRDGEQQALSHPAACRGHARSPHYFPGEAL